MHTSRYTHSSHRQTECERVGMPGGRLGEYAQERAPLTGREPGRGGLLATLAPLCARVAGEGSSQRGGEGGPHLQAATDRGPRMPAAAEREPSLLLSLQCAAGRSHGGRGGQQQRRVTHVPAASLEAATDDANSMAVSRALGPPSSSSAERSDCAILLSVASWDAIPLLCACDDVPWGRTPRGELRVRAQRA